MMTHSARPLTVLTLAVSLSGLLAGCGVAANTEALGPHYYVDAAALDGGDGSKLEPFPTISDACDQADEDQLGEVRIEVASGTYPEGPLLIDRPTSISGAGEPPMILGSFDVDAARFSLNNIALIDPGNVAVNVKAAHADVSLIGVEISDASGYGIRQGGGRLLVSGVTVAHTTPLALDDASGTAIFVAGGTQLTVLAAHLHHNVRGLHAEGARTHVDARNLRVGHSSSHSRVLDHMEMLGCDVGFDYLGAVEFGHGATGVGLDWTIADSVIAGLYVHDGAHVTVRRLLVTRTLGLVSTLPVAVCDVIGGFGVVAHQGGQIDLSTFSILDSDLCAVLVGEAPGTAIDLANGVIDRAPIGACVQQEGYDASRLQDRVEYRDVGVPLRARSYDLPDRIGET